MQSIITRGDGSAVTKIINHPYLSKLSFYLETPNDLEGYAVTK